MKYIIHPLVGLIFYLCIILIYIIWQSIYLIWHLKPNKFIIAKLFKGCYYCLTHRHAANSNWFNHITMRKLYVVPTSLSEWTKWVIKYGFCGEIIELTKKEEEYYLEFRKHNKPQS